MNNIDRQHSFEDQSPGADGSSSAAKRKSDDGSLSGARAKRNRYISIACNECKRRKIKCNGESPCQRCGNLSLECIYAPNCCTNGFKDSDEFRQMSAHMQSLQDQVNELYANLNALNDRQEIHGLPSANGDLYQRTTSVPIDPQISFPSQQSPPLTTPKVPQYQGPTTSAYSFDVAKHSLQTMGITQPDYSAEETIANQERDLIKPSPRRPPPIRELAFKSTKDPLWALDTKQVLKLCHVFEEEVGMMYPILDIDVVIKKATCLMHFLDSVHRTGLLSYEAERGGQLYDEDTQILKMVLAVALIIEGNGQSELGETMFESVRVFVGNRLWDSPSIKSVQILTLTAMYHFNMDGEANAYRLTGLMGRICFEMGLNRREALARVVKSEEERIWVVRLFWAVYTLDRRWSFGTGMPFAIHDSDVDPLLPEPDANVPYLSAMVALGRISSRVWKSAATFDMNSIDVKKDEIEFLDYQIKQWEAAIPESLRYQSIDHSMDQSSQSRGIRRLQVLLHLRANVMRILIYIKVLYSATSIMNNGVHAKLVVDVAKDTIRTLTLLNQTSDIYRTQQICFNYFLVSALAVLFLSVAHAPVEFSRQVRDEFYMALDLVKGFSTKSYVSKRLWTTIRGLKEIAPKLGLVSRQTLVESNDPHSSAAVAMAGLAGHRVDELSLFSQTPNLSSLASSPLDGKQMTYELTNLFEAAGVRGTAIANGQLSADHMNGYSGSIQGSLAQTPEAFSALYGTEEDFARIMRGCF